MDKAVKDAFNAFTIAKCQPLNGTGVDALHELLPAIYSIATLLEMGHRREERFKNEAALEGANPELVACAFDGIAHLAALAMFHAQDL